MKYSLTIKDNETGETVRELEFDCLIAGAHSEETSATIVLSSCNREGLLNSYVATRKAIGEVEKKHPVLKALGDLAGLLMEDPVEEASAE